MPEVNGKRYRTFGQGYAKEQGAQKEMPKQESGEGGGEEMHVKHLGGGRFETRSKHKDGKVTREQHDSKEELDEHMNQHFGLENEDADHDNESGESLEHDESSEHDGADAIHSILG